MKLYITFICLLFSICAFSQDEISQQNSYDGVYELETATVLVYNHFTNAKIDEYNIDLESTDIKPWNVYFKNLFKKLYYYDEQIDTFELIDNKAYYVDSDNNIEPIDNTNIDSDTRVLVIGKQLNSYTVTPRNNSLIIKTDVIYGQTGYSFPLKGTLVLVMNKK